jgi:hypothetical protein
MYSDVDGPVLDRDDWDRAASTAIPLAHHTSNRSKAIDDLALDDWDPAVRDFAAISNHMLRFDTE